MLQLTLGKLEVAKLAQSLELGGFGIFDLSPITGTHFSELLQGTQNKCKKSFLQIFPHFLRRNLLFSAFSHLHTSIKAVFLKVGEIRYFAV